MKSMVLMMAVNHPELIAYQESNNFGDQIITFRHEAVNGEITEKSISSPEGNWKPFDKASLCEMWESIK